MQRNVVVAVIIIVIFIIMTLIGILLYYLFGRSSQATRSESDLTDSEGV